MKYQYLKILIFALFITITNSGLTQEDNTASKILNDFSSKNQSFNTIYAKFSFSLENKDEDMLDSFEGEIIMKGEKYKLLIMDTETYFDGKSMWSYLPDFDEASISEPDEDESSMFNPSKIFNIYKEGFTNNYNGEKDGKYQISMIPDGIETDYSKIDVQIIKKTLQLQSVKYYGTDGNDYNLNIKSFKTNIAYADSTFSFDPKQHPGVEIIDLR